MHENRSTDNPQASERKVSLIILKSGDGRYVGSEDTYEALVVASDGATDLFELTELGSGSVALRALRTGKYVSAYPETGLVANREEIGPAETFSPVQSENGTLAFQLSDGLHYLSVKPGSGEALTANAVSVGPHERFSTEPVNLHLPDEDDGSPTEHSCCGPVRRAASSLNSDEGATVWADQSHQEIVGWALHVMRSGLTPEAKEMLEWWDRGTDFSDALRQGLKDADHKDPWRGTFALLSYMYNDHFYDPETQLNYMGQKSSAVTEGRRYFNLSVYEAMRILKLGARATPALYARAGYYLGLSLHFLTDLTQPMHAANFANVFAQSYPAPNVDDLRHKGFEEYAEGLVLGGYFKDYPPLVREDLELGGIKDAGQYLRDTAVTHRNVFRDKVNDEARKKVRIVEGPHGPVTFFVNKWGDEAKPAFEASLKLAPKVVARYLAYWAYCIRQPRPFEIDVEKWYRIIDSKGRYVSLKNEHFGVWGDTGANTLFYFVFNSDGTCTLACKGWEGNPWFVYKAADLLYYIGEYKNASGTPDAWCRFRVLPAPNGKVWFFEPSADEVVAVKSDGYLLRWKAEDDATQQFTLQPVGPISPKDDADIRRRWPHYGTLPWWGSE